jgi:hypothetical protein
VNAPGADTPPMTATTDTHRDAPLAVRPATAADAAALRDLARLDSARPLDGDVVLAEAGGAPVAALLLAHGRYVAHPFVRTGEVREMLRTYAARFATGAAPRRAPWSRSPQGRHVEAAA